MAMYQMTMTGEWGVNTGHLLAALFIPPDKQPPALWQRGQRPEAALAGVLTVHVRYLDAAERAPLGFCRLVD